MKTGSTWNASFDIGATFWDNEKVMCGDFENFDFLVIFGQSKIENCQKLPNFDLRCPENDQKIKIFKIPAHEFCIAPKSCPDIKTSILSAPNLHIFGLLGYFGSKIDSFSL